MEQKVPCIKCEVFILPETFSKGNGLCMKFRKIKEEEYTPSENIYKRLEEYRLKLIPVMLTEITDDIRDLYNKGVSFYSFNKAMLRMLNPRFSGHFF